MLRSISEDDETPIAEVVRRVGDLICTFDVPNIGSPVAPIQPGSVTERFTYYVPNPQLSRLTISAGHRNITIHELLRQGILIYYMRKEKAKRDSLQKIINPRELTHAPA